MKKEKFWRAIFIIVMITSMFCGIFAGIKYFASYELVTYVDTVTLKCKNETYESDVELKYTFTVEYVKDDGSIGTETVVVDNAMFTEFKVGDIIELLRTDAVRKQTVRDTYFDLIPEEENVE